jgi:hypothetical protein
VNFNYKITEFDSYILIKSLGAIKDTKEFKLQSKMYYEEITKRAYSKALIDETNFENPPGLITQALVGDYMTDVTVFPKLRELQIAVVPTKKDFEAAYFWETYSRNRGFNFRVFSNMKEALIWLNESGG